MTSNGHKPELYGLVLAGGKSQRMGTDKGLAEWYGKPHRYYLADLLSGFCAKVFISCRDEQAEEITPFYPVITDTVHDAGPLGAILSAFEKYPDVAWLVLACDLPLIDKNTIQFLVDHRNTSVTATTFQSPHDGLPEPLITIWEPDSGDILRQKAGEGLRCPRKVLMASEINMLQPNDPQTLMNANTPADAEIVHQILRKQATRVNAS